MDFKMQAFVLALFLGFVMEEARCQTSLAADDNVVILNAHNCLRGAVDPSATNMERMVWSDELSAVAQAYAEQCIFAHNANRTSQQSTFTYVGENLFASSASSADYASAVQSWYDEVADYDYATGDCTTGRVCGHYTQVVWAESRSVGCGVQRCDTLQNAGDNWYILVCNYGPGGNIGGQDVYLSGTSCSACPSDLPSCVDNLCSPEDTDDTCSTVTTSGITTATATATATTTTTTTTTATTTVAGDGGGDGDSGDGDGDSGDGDGDGDGDSGDGDGNGDGAGDSGDGDSGDGDGDGDGGNGDGGDGDDGDSDDDGDGDGDGDDDGGDSDGDSSDSDGGDDGDDGDGGDSDGDGDDDGDGDGDSDDGGDSDEITVSDSGAATFSSILLVLAMAFFTATLY